MRSLKNMAKIELSLQSTYELGPGASAREALEDFESLVLKLQRDCQRTFQILQREYDETFFVPLMVTGMALIARLYRLAQELQTADLPSARRKLVANL